MSHETFVNRFPEFRNAPAGMITQALATAANSVHASVWGADREEGLDNLAAHNLASGPGGFGVRTESKDPDPWHATIYGRRFKALMMKVTLRAPRVVGM